MINRTERVHAVDLAKCIAIIGVILIHVSSDTIGYAPIKSMEWLCGVFWGSVSRGAVPLFFLCSGALLLDPDRELSVGRIWKRNILHLLTALFFWAAVYKLYPYIAHGASLRDGIGQSVRELLLWKHETHLYFLHIMLLVYALLPATRLIAAKADRKTLRYLLVLWAVLGVLLPTAKSFGWLDSFSGIPTQWPLAMAWSAIGCTLLGFFLKQEPLKPLWGAVLFALGLLVCAGGTVLLSWRAGAVRLMLLEGFSPGPCMMAAGAFCLCCRIAPKLPRRALRAAEFGGKASFCIYLSHLLVQKIVIDLGLLPSMAAAVRIPIFAALCLAGSILIYLPLSRIPGVRRWLI